MHIIRRKGWEMPDRSATPEAAWLNRRALMRGAGAAGILAPALAVPGIGAGGAARAAVARNETYVAGRALTEEREATTYNNFYEFGSSKNIHRAASAMKLSPWTIRIEGMVKEPREIGLEDLLRQVSLEERVYRFRCVEAWAMTVPWTGFPVSQLLKLVEPLGGAKYLEFVTLADKKTMPGLSQSWYPWPYVEGCTVAEAANDLAFLATGIYGKPMPPQNGGPIRLLLPWKYGFKSGKSIVAIRFTDQRPKTFWEALQPQEYGFWANVNPEVSHPRWSQASERLIGSGERVPTQIYNGYGEFVAGLYAGMDAKKDRLFI
jgi:sulfoxide reductase catalytic subunit YedY